MGLSAAFYFLKPDENEDFIKIKHDVGRLVAVLALCPPAELSSTTRVCEKQGALSALLLVTRSVSAKVSL